MARRGRHDHQAQSDEATGLVLEQLTQVGDQRRRRLGSETEDRDNGRGTGTSVSLARADTKKSTSKLRAPMRSSIACFRCRRSKIKCDNDGGTRPCESCIKAGHTCQYPDHASAAAKRLEPPTNAKQEKEAGHEKKRPRKIDERIELDQQRAAELASDVLTYPFLTDEVWDQLFGLYRLHYASELSFLHIPTLKERMRDRKDKAISCNADLNLVLLGVLTLTSRHHLGLVMYITHLPGFQDSGLRLRQRNDPSSASDFFASNLTCALGPLRAASTLASLARIQALLMLGYYEWAHSNQERGLSAWTYSGMAIRLAQGLRLESSDRNPQWSRGHPEGIQGLVVHGNLSSDETVNQEIRHRTMFSCFVLDRMLACTSQRSAMIDPRQLNIPLPCTDMALDLALNVHTGFLRRFGVDHSSQTPTDESVLGRFIQLIDIWGDIAQYSAQGGRDLETEPLWYTGTTFRRLGDDLSRFSSSLPETFKWSRQNYFRHDNHQATSSYVALHMLMSLCQIILYRESLPFLPIRHARSDGSSPRLPPPSNTQRSPSTFWIDNAEMLAISAKNVFDIVELCKDKLPLSPLSFFSTMAATAVCIYVFHFPQLDERRILSGSYEPEHSGTGSEAGLKSPTVRTLFQHLHTISYHIGGAGAVLLYLRELDAFFAKIWSLVRDGIPQGKALSDVSTGFGVGAPSEDKGHGHDGAVKQRDRAATMSTNEDRRGSLPDGSDRSQLGALDSGQSMFPGENRSRALDARQGMMTTPSMSFTAINNAARPVSAPNETAGQPMQGGASNTEDTRPNRPTWMLNPSVAQIPEFESWRIAVVINDLHAFAGTGILGG